MSGDSAMSQQLPAWKRLGLKLKQPGSGGFDTSNSTPAVGHPSGTQHTAQFNKRKFEGPPATDDSFAVKKARKDTSQPKTQDKAGKAQTKPKKSVTFGDTPTKNGTKAASGDTSKPAKVKKAKGPAKKQKPAPAPTDIKPALEYLRQWKSANDTWKFNKNLQSLLIKRVFENNDIPAADIGTFYEYIRDLKGQVRSRLRETAMEIRSQDIADGQAGFPSGTKALDSKQETYETVLSDLLKAQHIGQKRKGYDEVEFIASSDAGDVVIRRVVKRMRAEMILDELSDGEQTDNSRTTQSSGTIAASENSTAMTTDGEQPAKAADGPNRRRRKLRTNVDDSSSSESESDSDSDSSSSSSDDSDESDSDDEEDTTVQADDGDDSSSSSSSSSSEEDSDSDDDSVDDDDE